MANFVFRPNLMLQIGISSYQIHLLHLLQSEVRNKSRSLSQGAKGEAVLSIFFSGHITSGWASTVPVILSTTLGLLTAFDDTTADLFIVWGLCIELYFKITFPESPGITGSFCQKGKVQPQPAFTLVRTKGSVPVFTNLNSAMPSWPELA